MTDPDDESLLDELLGDDDAVDAGGEPAPRPRPHPKAESREMAPAETVRRVTLPVGCREIGLTITGFVIFVSVDSIMMYTPFRISGPTSLLPQAITLFFLAFGLGTLLVWNIRGAWRPVGVGMMLGWVFMTLISAGYFTGLNP